MIMDKFFKPNSIAIIGASSKKDKVGGIILNNLLNLGYKGNIFPINPKYKEIQKLRCYSSLDKIGETVDLAVIAIPAEAVVGVIEEAIFKKVSTKNFVIISAGFSESGEEGQRRQDQIVKLAKKYDLKIIGPNCLGILNTSHSMNVSFSKNNFFKGKVGLITQSGSLATALFDLSGNENIGFSSVVTMGNKAQLDEADFLEYFKNDKQTEVIGLYLEDIKRGNKFCQVLRETTGIKPVVVLKTGNSAKTQVAIMSHTGAMAGEAAVAREAILQNGGIYVDDFLEFIEIIKILNGFKRPVNNKIVIVTNAGGLGVIGTDLIEKDKLLKLFEINESDKDELRVWLPLSSSVGNPIDLLGDAGSDRYVKVFEILSGIKGIGAVLAIVTPQSGTDITNITEALVKANRYCYFPVVPVVVGGIADTEAKKVLSEYAITNFVYPQEAVSALSNYIEMLNRKQFYADIKNQQIDPDRQDRAELILRNVKLSKRATFYFEEAAELASLYNINIAKHCYLSKSDSCGLKFPLVIKVDDPSILHKDKQGGVILNIENNEELRDKYIQIEQKFKNKKILAQEQVRSGAELIVGIKKDVNFGFVVMLGVGGIITEILEERMFWLLPTNLSMIKKKIDNSVIGEIINKQGLDLDEVAGEIFKLTGLAHENRWLKELDINPMIFYRDQKAIAVDIKVIC